MAAEKKLAPDELDAELRAYVADDIPARVGRLEKRVDELEPRAERAHSRAEEAVQLAQGVSFEWHDQRDALVRHVEQQGASVRDHLDSVTKQQNERIEIALGEARKAREVSEEQLKFTKAQGKKQVRMWGRVQRELRSSSAARRHELKKLGLKIPLYQALAVALIGAIVTVYAVRHGSPPPALVAPSPSPSAPATTSTQP